MEEKYGDIKHLLEEVDRAIAIIEEVEYLLPERFKTARKSISEGLLALDDVGMALDNIILAEEMEK